ncbi:protein kinase [Streptomyces coeruleorubidus]|uniref:protein kinase domain-containing protein n=1 Tax=Streptomyces coeruleorubidus TaxID=116188 RepID=UPI0037036536
MSTKWPDLVVCWASRGVREPPLGVPARTPAVVIGRDEREEVHRMPTPPTSRLCRTARSCTCPSVAERGPLPLAETASLGALHAEGLGMVHDAGLLHRDLKPQNILLSPYGSKVIDFGLAVLAERRTTLTTTGFVVGSVLCMPPEQARGEHHLDRSASRRRRSRRTGRGATRVSTSAPCTASKDWSTAA